MSEPYVPQVGDTFQMFKGDKVKGVATTFELLGVDGNAFWVKNERMYATILDSETFVYKKVSK